jgi:hypothetical protein
MHASSAKVPGLSPRSQPGRDVHSAALEGFVPGTARLPVVPSAVSMALRRQATSVVAISRSSPNMTITRSSVQYILHCSATSGTGGSLNIHGIKRDLNFTFFPNRRGEEKQ